MTRAQPTRRRWRLQFSLQRMLIVVALLATILGSLGGLLRPGPPWRMVGGVTDDLARGTFGEIPLAEPTDTTMQVERDPAEAKVYMMLAIMGPICVLVVIGAVWRAKDVWRWFWELW